MFLSNSLSLLLSNTSTAGHSQLRLEGLGGRGCRELSNGVCPSRRYSIYFWVILELNLELGCPHVDKLMLAANLQQASESIAAYDHPTVASLEFGWLIDWMSLIVTRHIRKKFSGFYR